MKMAVCRRCGAAKDKDVATHQGWDLSSEFDEEIYGFWGFCPKCREELENMQLFKCDTTLAEWYSFFEEVHGIPKEIITRFVIFVRNMDETL